jgi:hypothetical protein
MQKYPSPHGLSDQFSESGQLGLKWRVHTKCWKRKRQRNAITQQTRTGYLKKIDETIIIRTLKLFFATATTAPYVQNFTLADETVRVP